MEEIYTTELVSPSISRMQQFKVNETIWEIARNGCFRGPGQERIKISLESLAEAGGKEVPELDELEDSGASTGRE